MEYRLLERKIFLYVKLGIAERLTDLNNNFIKIVFKIVFSKYVYKYENVLLGIYMIYLSLL